MQIVESPAIVLQVTNLQERDRIVSFLTPERGLKRGVAQGARTKFSRFQGALHSLAEVEISWSEKPGRDLVRIRNASLTRGVANQPGGLEELLVGQYFAESVEKFTVEDEPAPLEFRLLRSCVEALRAGAPLSPLMRYFEVWLLQLCGIFSLYGECPVCGRALVDGAVLHPDADSLCCRSCRAEGSTVGRAYSSEALAFVRSCSRTKPIDLSPADPAVLAQVEDLAREIRRRFLGASLRSYKVMKRTLAEVGPAVGDADRAR